LPPGRRVAVEVFREGSRRTIGVTLGEREVASEVVEAEAVEVSALGWLGLEVEELDPREREEMKLPGDIGGLLVADLLPSSPLYDAGVRSGALLSEVNGAVVRSVSELEQRVAAVASGDYLRLYVYYVAPEGARGQFAIVQVP
jgi:serine protease Do